MASDYSKKGSFNQGKNTDFSFMNGETGRKEKLWKGLRIQIGLKRPFCHAFFPPVPGSVSFSKIFAKNIDAVLRFILCYCDVQEPIFHFSGLTRITFGSFFRNCLFH